MTMENDSRRGEQLLAHLYSSEQHAHGLLHGVNYPRDRMPAFDTAANFWRLIARDVENGIIAGGIGTLLQEAARQYPHSDQLREWRAAASTPAGSRSPPGMNLVLRGEHLPLQSTLEHVRTLARQLGITATVDLRFAIDDVVSLRLDRTNGEEVSRLVDTLRNSGSHSVSVTTDNGPPDYLYQRLFVEGPDQRRWEVRDVPASMTVAEVARGVVSQQYDNGDMWPTDRQGQPRPATVDVVRNGTAERPNQDSSLAENGFVEDETIHVQPEVTAASVSITVRDEAFARVLSQITAFAKAAPADLFFEVLANGNHMPSEYLLKFTTRSFAPPATPGDMPQRVDEHKVRVLLLSNFPMVAPRVLWRSPIFHPNVSVEGFLCLGELAERYRPGMDFSSLCRTIVDIASYRNYQADEPFNKDAANWARSAAGQAEIAAIGGRPMGARAGFAEARIKLRLTQWKQAASVKEDM
jgi:hypothetical protein